MLITSRPGLKTPAWGGQWPGSGSGMAAARPSPELIEGHAGRRCALAAPRVFFRELPTTPAQRWR